jgi:hypothetical protein
MTDEEQVWGVWIGFGRWGLLHFFLFYFASLPSVLEELF